jgi:hypothetical protein
MLYNNNNEKHVLTNSRFDFVAHRRMAKPAHPGSAEYSREADPGALSLRSGMGVRDPLR